MNRPTQTIALPVDAFALLIKSAAHAIINEMEKPASKVDAASLHRSVGILDELISKFETLHHAENSGQPS